MKRGIVSASVGIFALVINVTVGIFAFTPARLAFAGTEQCQGLGGTLVCPAAQPPANWTYSACEESSPGNAVARNQFCTHINKGTFVSQGGGNESCNNTQPIVDDADLQARALAYAKARAGGTNCNANVNWPGWLQTGESYPSSQCQAGLIVSQNGIETTNTTRRPWNIIGTTNGSNCATSWTIAMQARKTRTLSCPAGYTNFTGVCVPNGAANPYKNNEPACCDDKKGRNADGTNPINIVTGLKLHREQDYTGPGPFPLEFKRYYTSGSHWETDRIGQRWRHHYSRRLQKPESNSYTTVSHYTVAALRPNGDRFYFKYISGNWVADPDITAKLGVLTNASNQLIGWLYTTPDNIVEEYNVDGKLLKLTDLNGLTQILNYDVSVANGGDGKTETLDKVTDSFGRTLTFLYDAAGRIQTLITPSGERFIYGYNSAGILTTVTYADETPAVTTDNPKKTYVYNEATFTSGGNFPFALTGIIDENGDRFANYGYDSQGRAIFTEHANGADRVNVAYTTANSISTVTDTLGRSQVFNFTIRQGVFKLTAISGDRCEDCGQQYKSITYDTNGFVSSRTDFNGNVTNYINNSRGLETSRTEAFGTPDVRTITTLWHPTFRLPVKITEPGRETIFTYDSQGRLLEQKETEL